jgi:thioredoxin reductase (NADPH)
MTKEVHDLVIIGAGPSALAAAIYAAYESIDTMLVEKDTAGGIIASVSRVDNYPGFPDGIAGADLANSFRTQAEKFGAKIYAGEVKNIKKSGETIIITTDREPMFARSVLIATGSTYERLWISGEEDFYGKGVHYSTVRDGSRYRQRRIAVVGGGNSAIQEALALVQIVDHIDLVVRSGVKASGSLKKELKTSIDTGKITLYSGYVPDRIIAGSGKIEALAIRKADSHMSEKVLVDGVFIFAGVIPNTQFLNDSDIELDANGYVVTDDTHMTRVSGIFASGDARSDTAKQITTAIGDGTAAALAIRNYLANPY